MFADRSFAASEAFLERALKHVPLGSQTFSKSRTQYPVGASPLFLSRGHGAEVWDLDGNRYIDFVSALASVTLGYNDSGVTEAVRKQLDDGVILSLPHPLETEVAELICEMVPCAEMVRFGKNGSDATSGAVRLARAFTGRDKVLVCGYHGWQDWYIGSTARNRGVPEAVRNLTIPIPFNDIDAARAAFNANYAEIAAIILEPMNLTWPADGYLEGLRALADEMGALLIFDETITGFRFANGGAQELFGVTPDLACFGKGLANGYPLSAVVGRRNVMALMEEIFFSFTFGGELLSLAAAKAVLTRLRDTPVLDEIAARGTYLVERLQQIIDGHQLNDIFAQGGHPSWSFLTIADGHASPMMHIKTFLLQELHKAGFLCLGTHNLSAAHTDAQVDALLDAYADILPRAGAAARAGDVETMLVTAPLVPLFKVR